MNGHPGGSAHTQYMAELSCLPVGSRWLDLGAGNGDSVRILKCLGYEALGVDLKPRDEDVQKGDLLHTDFPSESFDGILSQCAFHVCGDPARGFQEAARLLKPRGKLIFSDVCFDPECMLSQLREAGFAVRHMEDLTETWREYYLEALWREENVPCILKGTHCSYLLLICERM